MSDPAQVLKGWFEKFQQIPAGCHLLCPRIKADDDENYRYPEPDSLLTDDERTKRILAGDSRVEITYWNSLVFGFEKEQAGPWLEEFTERLSLCLRECSECVINWYMRRQHYIKAFTDHWDADVAAHFAQVLTQTDVARIDHSLKWAQSFIEKIEASGAKFKKSLFGNDLPTVFTAVYEALCCVDYISQPDQRKTFQHVFMRLQGKNYLRLGAKDPIPGLTYFIFDETNEDRRKWAAVNWESIASPMSKEQFDWSVNNPLISAMDKVHRRDLTKASPEDFLAIENFWLGFESIFRTFDQALIDDRLRNLEVKAGCPNLWELLFRHINCCHSEGVLVTTIRVLTGFLVKAPRSMWAAIGDARPNVIVDIIFGSPIFLQLLQQSLNSAWLPWDPKYTGPFALSWVQPWLQSIERGRKYDACEVLLETLFNQLPKLGELGEPGIAACIRTGLDALSHTVVAFEGLEAELTKSTTMWHANMVFNLVVKYSDLIKTSMKEAKVKAAQEGFATFQVSQAAFDLVCKAMDLDVKLFFAQHRAILRQEKLPETEQRKSREFWNMMLDLFELSTDQIEFSKIILRTLGCLTSVEEFRKKKTDAKLAEPEEKFNICLRQLEEILVSIVGRIADFDTMDLSQIFADKTTIHATIGLSLRGDSDLAETSAEVLKSWTGQITRSAALEEMALDHTEQTLASIYWVQDQLFRGGMPWGLIQPVVVMIRSALQSLVDPSRGVLRREDISSRSVSMLITWWKQQWMFVSEACKNIENWSHYIERKIMTEFCREIMELAEALIMEDGLFTSAIARVRGKPEGDVMKDILAPAKTNFSGMEMMIRLKDDWLVSVTTRVLCKILTRLRENDLEINPASRQHIVDACIPIRDLKVVKYRRATNLTDAQRAEFLQALGHVEEEVEYISTRPAPAIKQSRLDAWSKSGSSSSASTPPSGILPSKSNRDDVLALSRSLESPTLRKLQALNQAKQKPKGPDPRAVSALKESREREKALKKLRDAEAIAKAKQLRGEAGANLGGVAGKERSEIMVNSSDEESDDDSDGDDDSSNQLADLAVTGQKTLSAAEMKQRQAMLQRGPVKKIRQQRSVKEMKARLIPPMEKLHNTILSWDIFHKGNEPPSGPQACAVAPKYSDPATYRDTFFPLLSSEAWRSFVTAKDEITTKPFGMKIVSRANVDNFLEITFTLPVEQQRERGVHEGDILLASENDNPLQSNMDRHCLARVHRIIYKKERVEVIFRVASRNNKLLPCLTPGNDLHGIKITNMTTIEREYAALESLQYYDLMDEILKAQPSPILKYGGEKVDNCMRNWSLNRGQALAVLGAQDNDGFTLIQGPPGTGKTKTIIAMVGSLLSEQLSQMQGPAVAVRPMGGAAPTPQPRGKKLLVCAPSNAAVDELVVRLKQGVITSTGRTRKINVLRLGRTDAISASVKDVTLDEMVRIRLEGDTTKDKAKADRDKLHERAGKIKDELSHLLPRIDDARSRNDNETLNKLSRERDQLKKQQMDIGRQIDADKASGNSVAREAEVRRRQIQQEILNSAQVLCATLSGSGHEMFRNLDVEFETVIIDEAAQCVELSALIPLKYGACKCILVGDPKQLPPTVLSQSAAKFGYDQSLFVRMQQNFPNSVHLLDMQYRMHPEISSFPSKEFYESQLKDGANMAQLRLQPWHKTDLLGPYRFFDVQGVQEKGHRGQSLVNTRELEVALQMYERFSRDFAKCDLAGKIGIITPYKAQLFELRNRFRGRYGESITDIIEFNTTDAFQGRECEIIIFSCVRASPTGGIGFMTDIRRMNVGLTRAKSSLWILGDSRALRQGEFWGKLIEDAKARDRYTQGDILSMFRKPLKLRNGTETAATPSVKDEDVSMSDAPPFSRSASVDSMSSASKSVTMAEVGTDPKPQHNMVVASRTPAGPPRIRTDATTPANETKKRSLESPDTAQPEIKRIAHKSRGGGLMNKFGQKPTRPNPPPTDPSGMTSLGLIPPERPPAPQGPLSAMTPTSSTPTTENPMKRSGSTSSLPSKDSRPPEANKPRPPPQMKKKAKTSIFMPKKR